MLRANAHTHLELTHLSHLCPPRGQPPGFTRWLTDLGSAMRKRSVAEMSRAAHDGIEELRAHGIDVVGDVTYTGASIQPITESGLGGVVYCEVQGFGERGSARFELVKDWLRRRRGWAGEARLGISIHSPYSCSGELIRKVAGWARRQALPMTIHVAESADEVRLVRDHQGPLRALRGSSLQSDSLGMTPVRWLESLGGLAPGWSIVHAVRVTRDDVSRLARSGCVIVHCPRSNVNLGVGRMPLEWFSAEGVEVVLGTDSRASAGSLSIADEIRAASLVHGASEDQVLKSLVAWKGC